MEVKKDEHIFNLRLTKEEIAYLYKSVMEEYKYYLGFNHKNIYERKGK
ncbi:unnamed protein product [marine sediment metagenome]|uniref:Uncharacterized protein n=1 Tax=marine sediment metagenome TaxID=412755 RepID=X1AIB4_9ZZZZ